MEEEEPETIEEKEEDNEEEERRLEAFAGLQVEDQLDEIAELVDDPVHNKNVLLRCFQQSADRQQRNFKSAQRRLIGLGVPIARIHQVLGPTKQQQQQQHGMYIKMVKEVEERMFDRDGSAKVLRMLQETSDDLEQRIEDLTKVDVG